MLRQDCSSTFLGARSRAGSYSRRPERTLRYPRLAGELPLTRRNEHRPLRRRNLPELMTGYDQLEEVPDDGIALIFAGRGLDEKIVIGQVPDFAFQQRRRHSELLRDLMYGTRLVISRVNDILRQGASKKIVGFAQSAGRTGMAHFPMLTGLTLKVPVARIRFIPFRNSFWPRSNATSPC